MMFVFSFFLFGFLCSGLEVVSGFCSDFSLKGLSCE